MNVALSVRAVRDMRLGYTRAVAAISFAGLIGRLLFLDHQTLWRDEAFTALAVAKPLGHMLDVVRADSAPPLGYLLQHFIAPLSPGATGLRLTSALAGTAAIPLSAALGRRAGGDRAGIASALLVMASPAFVLTARDARMYALAITLVLASTLLLVRAVERPSTMRWLSYAAVTTLALYTNYFAAFAVAAQLFAIGVVMRAVWRTALTAAVCAAVSAALLVPWLVAAHAQFTHTSGFFWVAPVGFSSTSGELVQFFTGPTFDTWVPSLGVLYALQGIAAAAGIGATAVLVWRWRALSSAQCRNAWFLLGCGAGALLLLLVLSIWRPLVNARYMAVMWAPLYPLVGTGFALITRRTLVAAGVIATASASVALCAAEIHSDTPAAIAWLQSHIGSDGLVDAYPTQYLLLLYYGSPSVTSRTHVVSPGGDVDWFWGTAVYPPGAVLGAVAAGTGTVYYVAQPNDPQTPVGLPPGYHAQSTECWTGVCVTSYTP